MRHSQFAVLLVLALVLLSPAFAMVSHPRARHGSTARLRPVTHPQKAARRVHGASGVRRTSHPVPASTHTTARANVALAGKHRSWRSASRHAASIPTETASLTETIPAEPMKHARIPLLPPLVGSRQSLIRQNERTEADGLERIENDAQLNELRRQKALVVVPASVSLRINEGLPMNRRYCRPWTAKFLTDLSRAHYARFHRPLQVNSAVRTVEYQRHLIETNGNAAPADGDIASPHLTGATIDIAKKGLSMSEVAWMRAYLLPLQMAGKLDVEEEFYQSCFHIAVYKSYAPTPSAPARHIPSTLLAERIK